MFTGNDSYQDRCSIKSTGESLFELFCQRKGYAFTKLGFDENSDPIKGFANINPMLRNLPDYIMETQKELFVVQVKGTQNFKKKNMT